MTPKNIVTRTMQTYWRMSRGLMLGVRSALIDADGRYLLIRPCGSTNWELPGGIVESGESVEMALRRLLAAQSRIEIGEAPKLYGMYAKMQKSESYHIALFVIRSWRQTAPPATIDLDVKTSFFAPATLPASTEPATLNRISEIQGLTAQSLDW